MAKYEGEGYRPWNVVPKTWNAYLTTRLWGLWMLVGESIVYENEDNLDNEACNKIFGTDFIAYDVLSAIVKKNVNADKILVHQLYNGDSDTQSVSDVQKILAEATNPQLIAHARSRFVVVIADASYGIDVWVWDLKSCR